jgi:hypothetical protein
MDTFTCTTCTSEQMALSHSFARISAQHSPSEYNGCTGPQVKSSLERDIAMSDNSYTVARSTPRFAFIAEAEIVGMGARARVSELSARGCYIDSINPLPKDTEVRLRIRYGCSTCDFSGTVIYTHAGFGMGVVFAQMTTEQRSTLDVWLDELARKLD